MTSKEIERLYPEFRKWVQKTYGYFTIDSYGQIQLWYEWLQVKRDIGKKVELPPRAREGKQSRYGKGFPPDNLVY